MTSAVPILLAVALAVAVAHTWLERHRPDPGEFDDIEIEQRKLAALARARKDHR